ncbi:MAG TPA: sulfatase-like hydrolase/transferase [Rhodanobacteraceae bacterium]|nr:sulfatase-like hydrolase/transferase [Rhodanobacteraceae bacterium]
MTHTLTTLHASLRPRLRPLFWLGACMIGISFLTRLALLWMTGTGIAPKPGYWLYAFAVGLGYDVTTFVYFAWPLVLLLWLVPTQRGRRSGAAQAWLHAGAVTMLFALCLAGLRLAFDANLKTAWPALLPYLFVLPMAAFTYPSRIGQWVVYTLCLAMLFVLLFTAAAELVFWNEFGSRFNFIAVDYLVYTREVLGNIRESYPVARWLALLAIGALVLFAATRKYLSTGDDDSHFRQRSWLVLGWLALTVALTLGVSAGDKDRLDNAYVNSLAGNGIYEFFAAFRNAGLNFHRFYRNLPDAEAYAIARTLLATPDASYVSTDPHDLTRAIRNPSPEQHLNVVLISVESLSADFMGVFGNRKHLTPNLDRLAGQSLFFDRLYANGTRTVRGLEALALSVPPTPGDSLLKQPHNQGLFSLADIFNQRGYESEFVYGGYGYFDDMNAFFSANGYTAVDRRDIPANAHIHSENVWGVADEDLYTLAMQRMDRIHARGKPFFLHLMTTSNHRPYTWPAGRVDLPQGKRDGAVKYTDWAIGDFIARMRTRPYFSDTVFVITADHCSASAGRTEIPLNRYHIPLLIYAPAHLAPRRVERMMAQVDIPPTLLGLLHFSYRSRFFGHDIFKLERGRERAFPSTYQLLGFLSGERLTILSPGQRAVQVKPDPISGDATAYADVDHALLHQAIAVYQVAYDEFHSGRMRWRRSDAATVTPLPPAPPAGAAPASP